MSKKPLIHAVYGIKNKVNGKIYIGSSVNYLYRQYGHKSLLKKSKHPNKHLQNSWNKHGQESFSFYILETVNDPYLLPERETFWINHHVSSLGRGAIFNLLLVAYSCLGCKRSDETRKKLSDFQKSRKNRPSPSKETRAKMSESQKSRIPHPNSISALINPKFRKPASAESIEKRLVKIRGVPLSIEHRRKMSVSQKKRASSEKGISQYKSRAKFSESDIQKILELRKSGMSFRSIAKVLNTQHPMITRLFKGTPIYKKIDDPLPPINLRRFKKCAVYAS